MTTPTSDEDDDTKDHNREGDGDGGSRNTAAVDESSSNKKVKVFATSLGSVELTTASCSWYTGSADDDGDEGGGGGGTDETEPAAAVANPKVEKDQGHDGGDGVETAAASSADGCDGGAPVDRTTESYQRLSFEGVERTLTVCSEPEGAPVAAAAANGGDLPVASSDTPLSGDLEGVERALTVCSEPEGASVTAAAAAAANGDLPVASTDTPLSGDEGGGCQGSSFEGVERALTVCSELEGAAAVAANGDLPVAGTDTPLSGDEGEESSEDWSGPQNSRSCSCRRCCGHPRVRELYTTADYWTLWIGLLSFALAVAVVFAAIPLSYNSNSTTQQQQQRVKYVLPQPMAWTSNPFDAWDAYNAVGIPILLLVMCCMYLTSLSFMGKLWTTKAVVASAKTAANEGADEEGEAKETTARKVVVFNYAALRQYAGGFWFMSALAVLALWFGSNKWCSSSGLGYAVFAILLGMVPTNIGRIKDRTKGWLQTKSAKDGEFFIKCSLVLLAVELDVLAEVGGPAMIVAWIGSPLAIVLGYALGTSRLFQCKDTLAMLIAVGASWCGASAISAVAPVVMASSEDVALAISVVAFFTILFTFVQPYVAMAVGMPVEVAGAWIGGSVDQTGNVIVSAAIISDEATEVAGIVKMVLNAGMGVMASVIACFWASPCRNRRHRRSSSGADGDDEEGEVDDAPKSKFSLIMLWDKFPKFTIGFIITSAVLTGIMQKIEGTPEGDALPKAISSMNKWWFAIAFVGIGLTTDIKKLFTEAWKSGIIQVYLVANMIDIFLALGLSYLAYRPE